MNYDLMNLLFSAANLRNISISVNCYCKDCILSENQHFLNSSKQYDHTLDEYQLKKYNGFLSVTEADI